MDGRFDAQLLCRRDAMRVGDVVGRLSDSMAALDDDAADVDRFLAPAV